MPFYTPRGLKIRVDPAYAAALLARLHPEVSAFRVLKTAEGIESLPGALAFFAAIWCFSRGTADVEIITWVVAANVAGCFVALYGLFFIPGLVTLGTAYSYLAGYGVLFLGLAVYGYLALGWGAVAGYVIGRLAGAGLNHVVEWWVVLRTHARTGATLTGPERSFLHAYRLHAARIGASLDIEVTDEEMHSAPASIPTP
jgi:hypothetical protein